LNTLFIKVFAFIKSFFNYKFEQNTNEFERTKKEFEQIKKNADTLSKLILKAKNNIRIFAGEGTFIFNQYATISALKAVKAMRPDLIIDVIISPVIFVEVRIIKNHLHKYNGIVDLAKKGLVNLYRRNNRTKSSHYYLIDNGKYYSSEKYHPASTSFLNRKAERLSRKKREERCNEFDSLKKNTYAVKVPEDDFLMLSYGNIKKVLELSDEMGMVYDDLTKEQVEKIVRQNKDVMYNHF
jgi:hypothetical protein